jgi:hypothetical protein
VPDVNQITKTPVIDVESRYPAETAPTRGLGEGSNQRGEGSTQKERNRQKKARASRALDGFIRNPIIKGGKTKKMQNHFSLPWSRPTPD